jgi:hypothetical protein
MTTPSHAAACGVTSDRPSAAEILRDEAAHCLRESAADAEQAAIRLRWLTHEARHEHGLGADEWLTADQANRLRLVADLCELVASDARRMLAGVVERASS